MLRRPSRYGTPQHDYYLSYLPAVLIMPILIASLYSPFPSAVAQEWSCSVCTTRNDVTIDECTWCSSDRPIALRLAPRGKRTRTDPASTSSTSSIPDASPLSASSSSATTAPPRPKPRRDAAPVRALRDLHTIHGDVTNRLDNLVVRKSAAVTADTGHSLGVGVFRTVVTPASPSGVVVAEYVGEIISVAESDARRARGEGGYSHHYCEGFVLWCRRQAADGVCIASRINGAYNAVCSVTGYRVMPNCSLINRTVNGITRLYVRTLPNVEVPDYQEFITTYGSLYGYEEYALPPLPHHVMESPAASPPGSPAYTGQAAVDLLDSAPSAAAEEVVTSLAESFVQIPAAAPPSIGATTVSSAPLRSALDLLDYSSDSS